MATVRVHLLTYRRPHLLRRALESLRAQTFTDWICELHNDAPDDPAPGELVRSLADPRIRFHLHARNLGPVATFNLAHAPVAEPFFSLLEDDNWWEPTFLARMLALLSAHPGAEIAWANMRTWQEHDNGWTCTGRTIWPVSARPVVSLAWPQLLQFDTPLHSNGAMLVRTVPDERLQLPPDVPFDAMENLRERAFRYPLLLVTEPLANFALTRQTARSGRRSRWAQCQALMGAAFLKHVALAPAEQAALWSSRRAAVPPATSGLFFAGLLQPTRGWLRQATAGDWVRFLRGSLRHPGTLFDVLRARSQQPALAGLFDRATAAANARPQGPATVPPRRLARREDLGFSAS